MENIPDNRCRPPQQGGPRNYPKFWQSLIMNQNSKLHSHCFPSRTRRLVARGPVKGTAFTYTILPRNAIIAYRFKREDGNVHPLYQNLTEHRDELDKSFGAPLDWYAGTEEKHDYIRCTIPHTGLEDERTWREIQKDMISCMNRLKEVISWVQ